MENKFEYTKKRMKELKDRKIIEIINIDYQDYTHEAIEMAKEELKNRGIKKFIVKDENKLSKGMKSEYILFNDLILQVRFDEVFKNLIKLYKIHKSKYQDYESVFNNLIHMSSTNRNDINILIEKTHNIFDVTVKELKVFGYDIKKNEKFEIEYLEWKDWLDSSVNIDQVFLIGKECYIAHCLQLMTRHGFTQSVIDDKFSKLELNQINDESIIYSEETSDETLKKIHPWRRLFARTIDYVFLGMILDYLWPFFPMNVTKTLYSINRIIYIVPFIWIFIEPFLISKTGTTIGKWILNIKIKKKDGELLPLGKSIYRSFLVLAIGLGYSIQYIQIITQIVAYFKLESNRESIWDYKIGSEIIYGRLDKWRVLVATLILIGIPIVSVLIYVTRTFH